jgi:hypothetical protein
MGGGPNFLIHSPPPPPPPPPPPNQTRSAQPCLLTSCEIFTSAREKYKENFERRPFVPTSLVQAVRNKLLRACCHQLFNVQTMLDLSETVVGNTCYESVAFLNLLPEYYRSVCLFFLNIAIFHFRQVYPQARLYVSYRQIIWSFRRIYCGWNYCGLSRSEGKLTIVNSIRRLWNLMQT